MTVTNKTKPRIRLGKVDSQPLPQFSSGRAGSHYSLFNTLQHKNCESARGLSYKKACLTSPARSQKEAWLVRLQSNTTDN